MHVELIFADGEGHTYIKTVTPKKGRFAFTVKLRRGALDFRERCEFEVAYAGDETYRWELLHTRARGCPRCQR